MREIDERRQLLKYAKERGIVTALELEALTLWASGDGYGLLR